MAAEQENRPHSAASSSPGLSPGGGRNGDFLCALCPSAPLWPALPLRDSRWTPGALSLNLHPGAALVLRGGGHRAATLRLCCRAFLPWVQAVKEPGGGWDSWGAPPRPTVPDRAGFRMKGGLPEPPGPHVPHCSTGELHRGACCGRCPHSSGRSIRLLKQTPRGPLASPRVIRMTFVVTEIKLGLRACCDVSLQ